MATTKKKRVVKKRATRKPTTRKRSTRKATARKVVRAVKNVARRKTSSKTKKRPKKKRSIKTCSGSGYYLKVSKNGRVRSVAGKGLRCLCPSASRPKCRTKRK